MCKERWWELDGGRCDNHRICFDGEWWGWENLNPPDLKALAPALLQGAPRWNHYAITQINGRQTLESLEATNSGGVGTLEPTN